MDYNNNTVQHTRPDAREIISGLLHDLPTHEKIHLPATTTGSLLPVPDYRYLPIFSTLPVPTSTYRYLPVFSNLPAPVFIVLQYPASGNKWFSESMSGILGLPVPIPVRVSSCSGTISGLLYGQIPAAGNQSPHTHNASLSQNIHIRVALRRYILSEGNAPCGCPAARE
jgi:hypothetical protein